MIPTFKDPTLTKEDFYHFPPIQEQAKTQEDILTSSQKFKDYSEQQIRDFFLTRLKPVAEDIENYRNSKFRDRHKTTKDSQTISHLIATFLKSSSNFLTKEEFLLLQRKELLREKDIDKIAPKKKRRKQ